ncbi:unnamed protein product [Orchesella dallaii]|uniref:Uncharacterized protein n=1 Tax=Orchesella dallaii TaxID=48710 RepID=A0ABP1Q3K1_9HEXA
MDFIPKIDETLSGSIELHYNSCFYCDGYYGPCFGEPTCATCHEFIFSEDTRLCQFQNQMVPVNPFESELDKDDGDSGNDEPSEEAGAGSAPVARSNSDLDRRGEPMNVEEPSPDDEEIEPDAQRDVEPDGDVMMPMEMVRVRAEVPVEEWLADAPSPPVPAGRLQNQLALLTNPRPTYEFGKLTDELQQRIPPEIWAAIFRKLDEVTLLMASKVNSKWKAVVLDQFPNLRWEEFVKLRWPLFHPIYPVQDWYTVFSDLIDSVPCKLCFMNLTLDPQGSLPPARSLRSVRLQKEIKWLRIDHPEGIEAVPLDRLNYNWLARIHGPPQSVYQGGVFYLNLKVPHDYPIKPPEVRFLTKLFHPNVSRHGDIGIDCIQHNWTLALTISQVLLSVQSLLTDPYLETNMEPKISELYMNDRKTFDKIARVWTWKYAMHDVLIH